MSEAARVRESIDLAEFERRLRGAHVEEPQTAHGFEPMAQAIQNAPRSAPTVASRPSYPRTAEAGDARVAANPVADLRGALEEAAAKPDPFHSVVDNFPNAAERFGAPAEAAQEPGWRPEAFEPIGEKSGASTRKRMLLLGGAAAVLVVGVGVTLSMRGGSTGGNAPTIRASNEPFKIQPEAKPAGEKPSETASILDRNGSERLAASRVVTREEQPVDVREAGRQAAGRPGPSAGAPPSGLPTAGPAANGFFPEPRRVRTVSVRPDGTIISDAQPAAPATAPRAAAPVPSRPAAPSAPQAAPVAPQTAAPPAVRAAAVTPPKTPERASPTTTASTGGAAATPAAPATRAASPQSAAVAATPRAGAGAFAVQLAAPGSESEANAAIARIQQRYGSALGGLKPTVRKAKVGEKDVYRVRVVGLSQSDANGVCEKLKSAGGSCFVARE